MRASLHNPGQPPERIRMTAHQIQIIDLMREGLTTEQIAQHLGRSYWTIRTHIRNARERNNSISRTELADQWAQQENETQKTITEWGDRLFGKNHADPFVLAVRALEEMAELIALLAKHVKCPAMDRGTFTSRMIDFKIATERLTGIAYRFGAMELKTVDLDTEGAALEAADVSIVLDQFMTEIGMDMVKARNAKMAINRKRKWTITKYGVAQHVKHEDPPWN